MQVLVYVLGRIVLVCARIACAGIALDKIGCGFGQDWFKIWAGMCWFVLVLASLGLFRFVTKVV